MAKLDKPRRPKPPEPIPVVGGRFLAAAAIVGAMVIIPFSPIQNWFPSGPSGPKPTNFNSWVKGESTEVSLTLITADYALLACSHDKPVGDAHCAFKSETEAWPLDESAALDNNKKDIVQPYRTYPDNKLVLLSGVWATPEVALRLHREPPTQPANKLARFILRCQVTPLENFAQMKVRWQVGQRWLTEGPAWAARADSCQIIEDE